MWGIIQEGNMKEGEEEINDEWKILSQDCPLPAGELLRVLPRVSAHVLDMNMCIISCIFVAVPKGKIYTVLY